MGLLDLFINKKVKELEQQNLELKRLASISIANLTANTNIALWPEENLTEQTARYVTTDDIYSVIKRLATTAALVPIYGYLKTPDSKIFNRLLHYNFKHLKPQQYRNLQTKALEDLPEVDPVAMLLENPHEEMGKFEFFVELFSWLFLDGEVFLKKERPDNGTNQGMPVKLAFMAPQCVTLRITETLPHRVTGYDYRIEGVLVEENIPTSEVIHIKYFNPVMNNMGGLRGLSPVKVLCKRLARSDSNMNVSTAQLQNGGVPSIVYDKTEASTTAATEIVGARKDNFYRFRSNPRNAGSPFFASGEMGVLQLGSHLADMGVIELGNIDFKKFCNAYAVSDRLFNNDATGSEISDDNARKGLYTNCVLPNIYMVRDAFINGLLPDFEKGVVLENNGDPIRIPGDGKKRFIDCDITEITELQEDLGKTVNALAAASWLTLNEKRDVMGYEIFENPLMDQILIGTGIVPLDDLNLPDPVEQVTPNGL